MDEAERRSDYVKVERTRHVRERRGVSVVVALQHSLFGAKDARVSVSSGRDDEGEWSPATVDIGIGANGFSIDDWEAIKTGVDRAVAAYRLEK